MPRKGRGLELVLEKLHKIIDKDAYDIQSPMYVKDVDTGKQRELDVGIRKKNADNEDVLIAIDCRDRKGVQDVRWVEELMGKKVSVGANVYYVITSSSFTHEAQLKALARGIILRRVEHLSPEEIEEFIHDDYIQIHYVESALEATDLEFGEAVAENFSIKEVRFIKPSRGLAKNVAQLLTDDGWKPIEEMEKMMNTHGEVKKEAFMMLPEGYFVEIPGKLIVQTPRLVPFKRYKMTIEVKKFIEKIPLQALKQYKDNSNDVLLGEMFEYGNVGQFVMDSHEKVAGWFFDVSHVSPERHLTRISFVARRDHKLGAVLLKTRHKETQLEDVEII